MTDPSTSTYEVTEISPNLVAAAPELLAACRLALDIIENDDGCGHGTEAIRAAIAKATA